MYSFPPSTCVKLYVWQGLPSKGRDCKSGQPAPALDCPLGEKAFPYIQLHLSFFSTYFYSSRTTVWIFDVCFLKSTSLPLIQISIEYVWWLGTWRITAYLHIVIATFVIPIPFKFLCSTLFIKYKWVIYLFPGTLIIWSGDSVKMYSAPTNY